MRSGTTWGIEAYSVDVEVEVAKGLPAWHVVGLPAAAVKEGRVRIRAALEQSNLSPPTRGRTTVNLAPADIKKEGSAFDLAIALAFLTAHEMIPRGRLDGWLLIGELALDGSVRAARGVLPIAVHARASGAAGIIVPIANEAEAAVVEGLDCRVVSHIAELVEHARGNLELPHAQPQPPPPAPSHPLDFSDVRGQRAAKRAIEIAAAGHHNLLMVGPPGAGKTMLARRIPTVLPALPLERALETTAIYSVAGLLGDTALVRTPPFRAPHHSVSDAGLLGGGSPPRPGEISLSSHGVLFLDELPEFRRSTLEALRQPLEDGCVRIARARHTVCYPARLMLVAAMNPCPCGHHGDATRACRCAPAAVLRYRGRLSGPLLDRIDLHIGLAPVPWKALSSEDDRDHGSAAIAARVAAARERQLARLGSHGLVCNADMGARLTRALCRLDAPGAALIERAVTRMSLSARSVDRVLKVARTIADLAGAADIARAHLAEAIGYRLLDTTPVDPTEIMPAPGLVPAPVPVCSAAS